MKDPRPTPVYRKDYQPPAYTISRVELAFELDDTHTIVHATLAVLRTDTADASKPGEASPPLVLHGEKLDLECVEIDGTALPSSAYKVEPNTLTIHAPPQRFELRTRVRIEPQHNTELSGLYKSGATFCTQCEAEGFRRITYFLDRPDVMATYRTTITASRHDYPVLLSNGNQVEAKDLGDGRHLVTWEDPFPKPSYLFALVAADLHCESGSFTTKSGREVRLEIWVEKHNTDACEHALRSLAKAMRWDEQVYGLEYDLDVYMIVAVSDFNMAAMENKGLNVFNAKYVLARPQTATDADYEDIEGVIAHEYFHNWTGNRVTCRDWFQLTLKEGLTVFRDEQFTADMTSQAVKRIQDVRLLRTAQFAEDASPTAHPIRPDAYIEMNNFYTVTVYNKGAEVIRMYDTLLGSQGFRKGMDLYFERHDGQAVTCDDFRAAMADASGVDLEQFGRWYEQAGTPIVHVTTTHDAASGRYTLTLRQQAPSNVDPATYSPMHIPVATGLVDSAGQDLALTVEGAVEGASDAAPVRVRDTTALLELRESEQSFVFSNVPQAPALSILRGFSAPVKLELERTPGELALLMGHDSDAFSRWDAAQTLALDLLLEQARAAQQGKALELGEGFVAAFGQVLAATDLDNSLKALTLRLPHERFLAQQQEVIDVEGVHAARSFAQRTLANAHKQAFWATYERLAASGSPYASDRSAVADRQLKNISLGYLVATGEQQAIERALQQFREADNMTDAQAALGCLADCEHEARDIALAEFLTKWEHDPLVVDKWFVVQAASTRPDTLQRVRELTEHRLFSLRRPNSARGLLGTFSGLNKVRFHAADGGGYALLADKVLELDAINPQVAARLIGAFTQWRRYDSGRQEHMRNQLGRIVSTDGLSADVYELASKSLGADK